MAARWHFSGLWRVEHWLRDESWAPARLAMLDTLFSLLDDPRAAPARSIGMIDRHEAFVRNVELARVQITYLLWQHSAAIRILRLHPLGN